MDLERRRILIGVTAGIAAYKIPQVVRLLKKSGAEVRVVMTSSSRNFVAVPTLEVLTRHAVHSDLFERNDEFPVLHVGLAEWAELILIAPATANFIGKMANGIGDDLLSTLLLTAHAPVMLAPAMEEGMLTNPHVERNIRTLRKVGVGWIEPETGELASGSHGKGRMASSEGIASEVAYAMARLGSPTPRATDDLQNLKIMVTAGPTCEDLDPVRFISNRSSGKMGYAIATQAVRRGASVSLISGPTSLASPSDVEVVYVRSAAEMLQAARTCFVEADVAIMAAAVADYRVANYSRHKIKSESDNIMLELTPNTDISAELGCGKGQRVVISFAMETELGTARAHAKLIQKQSDLIAMNNLCEEGAGFGVDTNVVTLIDEAGVEEVLPKMSKRDVADILLDRARDLVAERRAAASG